MYEAMTGGVSPHGRWQEAGRQNDRAVWCYTQPYVPDFFTRNTLQVRKPLTFVLTLRARPVCSTVLERFLTRFSPQSSRFFATPRI